MEIQRGEKLIVNNLGDLEMEIVKEKKEKGTSGKRGRKKKNEKVVYELNKEQTKFFIDLSSDNKSQEKVFNLLEKCNQKDYGREIQFKDIVLYSIEKVSEKDIEKIQEVSLSEMEKVERLLNDYNKRSNNKLSLGEFLVKKLNIN